MGFNDRQKICSHCDGRIAIEADTCLYCGTPLTQEKAPEPKHSESLSIQQSLDSLYPPPYPNRNTAQMKTDKEFTGKFKTPPKETSFSGMSFPNQTAPVKEQGKSSFIPILMALLGSNLFILGLMQGLFSEGGFLRLEWNSDYWFVFCLISIPMLYLGMKKNKDSLEKTT